jgi:hypothetical protein
MRQIAPQLLILHSKHGAIQEFTSSTFLDDSGFADGFDDPAAESDEEGPESMNTDLTPTGSPAPAEADDPLMVPRAESIHSPMEIASLGVTLDVGMPSAPTGTVGSPAMAELKESGQEGSSTMS